VLPLDDRKPWEIIADLRPQVEPARDTYTYYPNTAEVPEAAAPNIRGRSFKVLAEVELDSADAEGVIFAQGGRFGGHALFLKDHRAHYVYNFLGEAPEQLFSSGDLAPGRHVIGMDFAKDSVGEHNEAVGTTRLHVDDAIVAEGTMRTQVGMFTLCGDGLCVGRDSSDAVSSAYTAPADLTGATVLQVEVNVGDDQYIDLEREAFAALARE
jgi:hypothetical protein